MIDEIKQVYGPLTWNCSRYGWFTKYILYFVPTIFYETPDRIVVYKLFRGEMFVCAAVSKLPPKPNLDQCQKPWES